MDKLEAAEKLAKAAGHLLGDYDQASAAWDEVWQAIDDYRKAPAIPPLEKILAAMEFFADPKLLDSTFPELQTRDRISRKTLSELRKAVKP